MPIVIRRKSVKFRCIVVNFIHTFYAKWWFKLQKKTISYLKKNERKNHLNQIKWIEYNLRKKKKTLTKYGLHYNFWFYQTLTNQFLLQFTSNEENTLAIKPFTEFYVRDRKSYWRFCVNFSWKCECGPRVCWCFWCILFIVFERTCSVCACVEQPYNRCEHVYVHVYGWNEVCFCTTEPTLWNEDIDMSIHCTRRMFKLYKWERDEAQLMYATDITSFAHYENESVYELL